MSAPGRLRRWRVALVLAALAAAPAAQDAAAVGQDAPGVAREWPPFLEEPVFPDARGPHALVVLPDGRPVVVYQTTGRRVALATTRNAGRTWVLSFVDRNRRRGAWIDAAVTADGALLVAYADEEARALRFGRSREGGEGFDLFRELDPEGLPGAFCSVLAPGGDRVAVAHYDGAAHALEVARSDDLGETWETVVVDDVGDPGRWCRLVALDADRWVVLYRDDDTRTLRAARSDDAGRTWRRGVVDPEPGSGAYLDAAAAGGELVAVYRDYAGGRARRARSTDGGATWTLDTLVEAEPAPAWSALADGADAVFAASCGAAAEGVRLLAWEPGGETRAWTRLRPEATVGPVRLAVHGDAVWLSLHDPDAGTIELRRVAGS